MHSVLMSFIQQVQAHPENTAIAYLDITISYRELDEKSDLLCQHLQKCGIGADHIIPLIAQRTPEYIVGIIAILKAGASYIPVDIRYPQKRITQIIEQSGSPVIVISHNDSSAAVVATTLHVIAVDSVLSESPLSDSPRCASSVKFIQTSPEDTVYVIFTSGTTGVPKGVMVSHAALHNLVSWHNTRFHVDQHCRSTLIAGISFDVAQWEIWSPLVCGATLILPDSEDIRLQADMLLHFFSARRLTHAFVPTVLIAEFVQQPHPENLALRYLFTAGEKLNPVNLSSIPYPLIDYYGPTEATIFTTCNVVTSASENPVSSIGLPVAGAEIFIVDEQFQPVTGDEPGELLIAGPGLARGYLNNHQLTAEKFLTLPFAPEKRVYRSGDRARWLPDGQIQYLGRFDDQIKIRGNRIELGEIQSVLMQAEGVKAAIALVAEVPASGEKKILTFVAANAESVSLKILRSKLADSLPAYFMPAGIQILPHLPLTPNGKIDKQSLLTGYQQDTPISSNSAFQGLEAKLAAIWHTLLGNEISSPDDNFFDLGGHSLLAAKMATMLTEQTHIRAYVRDIYDASTIRSLGKMLEERSRSVPLVADSEPLRMLQDDVFLPDDIHISPCFDEQQIRAPRTIFLTGASGFVGSHLLADLLQSTQATIYCLIRGRNEREAEQKISATLSRYLITLTAEQRQRIRPLAGDLSASCFALKPNIYQQLCEEIDLIYHSASAVNFIQPYSWMKRDNVQGLKEIIRFAAIQKTKPLMLLSTISVYSWGHLHTGKKVMYEDDDIDQNLPAVITDIGYVRSKWVMEKIADLAASRGLPLATFRLGYATMHSKTGVSADYQWWGRLVKTCLDTGTVPILEELREGLTTVDYMTQAIAWISRNPQALDKKFNLIHEQQNNLTLSDFFQRLGADFGFNFRPLPYADWLAQWEHDADAPLYPLLSLFKDNMVDGQSTVQLYQHTYKWDCRNVKRFLQGSSLEEPKFNREQLARYLKQSIKGA